MRICLAHSATESIPIKSADGEVHEQTWYYPSRQDCLTCHTARRGRRARRENAPVESPLHLSVRRHRQRAAHLESSRTVCARIQGCGAARVCRRSPRIDDTTRSLEDRARSYLDANCAQCHRPGGTVANFDARYDTPLDKQALIDGPVLIDQGIDRPRVISPHDIWRSIAYMRVDTVGDIRMPPLARETIDQKGVQLLGEWINSMPGPPVLAPPRISPQGGTYYAARSRFP